MKKLVLAAVACLMVSGVAMAESKGDFDASQTKMDAKITKKMESFKEDAEMTKFLTDKKACVAAATDVAGLDACKAKFPPPAVPAEAAKK